MWALALQVCKINLIRSSMSTTLAHINRYGSHIFLGLHIFPRFPLWEWFNTADSVKSLAKWLRCLWAWAPFKKGKRGVWKNIKQALCRHLWSVSVTAWSAISSSPTEAVSCAPGRQPGRPPAPRTLAVGAGGPCSTLPHPGMTSAGRCKWRGRGGGETGSPRRLET